MLVNEHLLNAYCVSGVTLSTDFFLKILFIFKERGREGEKETLV